MKALKVVLLVLVLVGLGVGGFFLTTKVILPKLEERNEQTVDEYTFTKDERYKKQVKAMKKQVGKGAYNTLVRSLDASVDKLLSSVPEQYKELVISLLQFDEDTYTVTLVGLDTVLDGANNTYTVVMLAGDEFMAPDEVVEAISVLFTPKETEEESLAETQPTADDNDNTLTLDDLRSSPDYIDMTSPLDVELVDLPTALASYKEALKDDEKYAIVESCINGLQEAATTKQEDGAYWNAENTTLYYVVTYNDVKCKLFIINTSGEMVDYSDVYKLFTELAQPIEKFPDVTMPETTIAETESVEASETTSVTTEETKEEESTIAPGEGDFLGGE